MKTHTARPILCGTDFSENAAQASAAAAALAQRWNKPLMLLHAADEFHAQAETKDGLERFLQSVRQRLHEETERLAASGAAVTGELLHGQVAEQAILAFAEQHPADLIVVSSVSKTAVDRWTLGSVSETIAETAPAATLIVRAAAPFEAWAGTERPLKVFVAVDASASAEAALRWVGELRKVGPCDVTAAHVNWPPEDRYRLGVRGVETFTQNIPEVQRVLERDLREKVTGVLGEEHVDFCVHANWGRVDVPLIALATAAQADLLVVGTHQRHGLGRWTHGSISRGVLRHAPMSVACVPASAMPAPAPAARPCRRVLAAADLTEHGGLALPYAYSVVSERGTVALLHVTEPFRLPNPLIGGVANVLPTKKEVAARVAHASARLRAFIPNEAQARGIKSEVEIIESDNAARAICQAAESFSADLVCIGAHARPGAAARAMGSVALGVLQHCRRPVLVVWEPVE